MVSKTIKVSEENYLWLLRLASELQKRREKPISFDDTLQTLREGKMGKNKISDLAGSWKMSNAEAEKFKKDARKGWGKWKIPSV